MGQTGPFKGGAFTIEKNKAYIHAAKAVAKSGTFVQFVQGKWFLKMNIE